MTAETHSWPVRASGDRLKFGAVVFFARRHMCGILVGVCEGEATSQAKISQTCHPLHIPPRRDHIADFLQANYFLLALS